MPTLPILKTKISAPSSRRYLVSRKAALQALQAGLTDGRRVTLLSAPAGFGKTTLVSEWLDASAPPAAWFALDEQDSDPTRFLTYLIAALQTIVADLGAGVMATLHASNTIPTEALLTSLLNELAAVEDGFVMVLDDYHVIDSKAVDGLLLLLVEHMPPAMHLVITTREDPPLPLPRLRARNQLTEIRAAELRFTETEAAEFLNQAMGLHLTTEEVAALEARTEGWVAGLQLAALSMQGEQDTAGFIRSFSGAHQFILDYLVEEVLQKQSASLQGFLLHTSVLDRLNAGVCDALWPTEPASAQATLEYLERANLFVIPLDGERRWYRFHHLFRDLLRQRLAQTLTPTEVAQVHVRASAWFEQNGDLAEAFRHAMAATDFDRAARLAEIAWLGMDESFQMRTWLGWVNQLPVSVKRARPVLCTQIGWAHMDMGNPEASESSLREAEDCLKRPRTEMVIVEAEQFRTLPARIAMARAYNAQAQHRFADTVRFAEMALDLIPYGDPFMQAQASAILSGVYWASGELDKAYGLMSTWVDAAQQAGNFVFAVAASFGKADILITQGRLRDAMQVYAGALDLAAAHDAENFTAHHHLGLGLLYHELGDDERATQHHQKALEVGRQTTIVDWAYRKHLAQAQWKESEGDLPGVLDSLDAAQRFYVRTPIPNLRPIDALKAQIHLKQGSLAKARAWARNSGLTLQDAPDHLHEFERLTLAKAALAEYQNDRNEQHIRDVLQALDGQFQLAKKQNRLRGQIETLVLQACALHAQAETVKAISALEQALTLAEPEGYLRLFVNGGPALAELLPNVKDKVLQPYIQKILALATPPKDPQPASFTIQPLIDPLSDRELEVLRLIAEGLSNNEICERLFVALSTVKGHNLRIFNKLQAKSRTEAVARARALGLL